MQLICVGLLSSRCLRFCVFYSTQVWSHCYFLMPQHMSVGPWINHSLTTDDGMRLLRKLSLSEAWKSRWQSGICLVTSRVSSYTKDYADPVSSPLLFSVAYKGQQHQVCQTAKIPVWNTEQRHTWAYSLCISRSPVHRQVTNDVLHQQHLHREALSYLQHAVAKCVSWPETYWVAQSDT